jgi:hypothetical protein
MPAESRIVDRRNPRNLLAVSVTNALRLTSGASQVMRSW